MKSVKIFLIAGLSLFTISSCKKGFKEINDDPNNPSVVPTSFLLTGAQKGMMDNTVDHWWGGQVGNQLAQYWSSNQYSSESRYQFRTSVTNQYWNLFYAGGVNSTAGNVQGGLKELQQIIDLCTANPGKYSLYGDPNNQIAVATILKTWLFQNMTDTWGEIPYSESLKGVSNPSPKYDKQSAIYTGLLADIDKALALIDDTKNGPSGDLVYDGDMTAWKKFANSLKVRIALRMADKESATASAKINEAIASGIFTSNADNALYHYGASAADGNPNWYDYNIDARNDFCASNIMVDKLKGLNDPRISYFYAPQVDSPNDFVGEVYGLSEANGAATEESQVSQRSDLVMSQSFPGIFLDYAQIQFALAEAVERGYISGVAKDYYNEGIKASMDFWSDNSIAQTDIDAYIAQSTVDYDQLKTGGKTWREIIGTQKWISLYNQGIQGWAEWRRLDFGILQLPADGPLAENGIPNRMLYPTDEQRLNSANYQTAVASQGADLMATKVWWDAN